MSGINAGRVIGCGLLAGLVTNIIDFIVNVPLLGARWEAATKALGIDPAAHEATSALGWISSDFMFGVILLWLYAAMRPRFGPGPKTALIASVALWIITHIAYGSMVFMGLFPASLMAASGLGGLVAIIAGGQIGCRFYAE